MCASSILEIKPVWNPAHSCFPASRPCFQLPCFHPSVSCLASALRIPASCFPSNLNCCSIGKTDNHFRHQSSSSAFTSLISTQHHVPRNSRTACSAPVLSRRDTSGLERDQEQESGIATERELTLTLTPLRAALSSSSDQSPSDQTRPDQTRATPASRLCLPARSLSHQSSNSPRKLVPTAGPPHEAN